MSTLRSLAAFRLRAMLVALAVATVAGALTVFRADALPPTIDLNTTPASLTVYGDDTWDHSGFAVAAGDINGDGKDDLIIGAHWAEPPGGPDAGETYVIYGGAGLPATIDLNSTSAGLPATIDLNSTSADLTVYGDDGGDESGHSVAAGDIDGDTTDDLIIGARSADPAGGVDAGETYVIYGGPSLPATIDLNSESADLTVFGDDAYDYSGWSVAAGDIDGDTTDDLIIGAYWADGSGSGTACGTGEVGDRCEAGETYVIYGGPTLPATIDLNSTAAGLTVYGDDASDFSGFAVAAGDIDGDTTDDLIIGAFLADPAGGGAAGETYVVYGGDSLPATIDLDSTSAGLTVYGDDASDFSGFAVAAGDIDGDGTDDLIIGAYAAEPAGGDEAGETYVIYGGPGLPATIDLNSTSAGLTVYGDDAEDWSGGSVAAGNINGDAYDDLIIGAGGADGSGSGTGCGPGEVGNRCAAGDTYVIYGEGACPDDGDGIAYEIDTEPCVFSDLFDDRPLSPAGTTFGEVTLRSNPSNLNVNVTDLANPDGVSMTAKGPGGAIVQILVCGFLPLTFASPGETRLHTCSSAVVEVVSGGSVIAELGSVSAELVAGTTVTISQVSPGRFQVTNWASSTASITIDGLVLAPGESVTVPVTPVGGISVDPDLGALPLETAGSSGSNVGVLAGVVAGVMAGAIALGGAAWWARRRRVR